MKHSTITKTHLISMIDGKGYKELKRHILSHGMTCDEYRAKFGLPDAYPMVHETVIAAKNEYSKKCRARGGY